MARNECAPANSAEAAALVVDQQGSGSCGNLTVEEWRHQFLIRAHHVRPEWAPLLAATVFGGGHG